MRPAASSTTSKRLSEKPRRKPSGEGSPMTEEILGDPSRRRCHYGNPLYQSSLPTRATYTFSSSSSRSSNSSVFVCADVYATCTTCTSRTGSTRYTCNVTRELVGARDIRGSQFIFPVDSSKNLLRLICHSSGRRNSDASLS